MDTPPHQKRMKLACTILAKELHPKVKFVDPQGGYFIWLTFPKDFDVASFNQRLKDDYQVWDSWTEILSHQRIVELSAVECGLSQGARCC